MRDYTKYEVWIDGIEISVKIHSLTDSFPNEEKFGIVSQLRRLLCQSSPILPRAIVEARRKTLNDL